MKYNFIRNRESYHGLSVVSRKNNTTFRELENLHRCQVSHLQLILANWPYRSVKENNYFKCLQKEIRYNIIIKTNYYKKLIQFYSSLHEKNITYTLRYHNHLYCLKTFLGWMSWNVAAFNNGSQIQGGKGYWPKNKFWRFVQKCQKFTYYIYIILYII